MVVTPVDMFGKGGGWGIGILSTHNPGLTVGGSRQKPGLKDGEIAVREFLNYLTMTSFMAHLQPDSLKY